MSFCRLHSTLFSPLWKTENACHHSVCVENGFSVATKTFFSFFLVFNCHFSASVCCVCMLLCATHEKRDSANFEEWQMLCQLWHLRNDEWRNLFSSLCNIVNNHSEKIFIFYVCVCLCVRFEWSCIRLFPWIPIVLFSIRLMTMRMVEKLTILFPISPVST